MQNTFLYLVGKVTVTEKLAGNVENTGKCSLDVAEGKKPSLELSEIKWIRKQSGKTAVQMYSEWQ